MIRPIGVCLGLLLIAAPLAACPRQNGPTIPQIRATASVTSRDGNATPIGFDLTHTPDGPGARVGEVQDAGVSEYSGASISATPPGLSEETYILQTVSRSNETNNGDPLNSDLYRMAGDVGYFRARTGDRQYLALEVPQANSATTVRMGAPGGRRDRVSAVFARVGPRAVTLPWRSPNTPNCPRLQIPGEVAGLCFTNNDFVRRVGGAVSALLINRYDTRGGAPDLNVWVRTVGNELVGYVPSYTPAATSANHRLRGFVLIFRHEMRLRLVAAPRRGGRPSRLGTPEHKAWVYIPVAVIFEALPDGGVSVTADPLTSGMTEMIGHTAVVVDPLTNTDAANSGAQAAAEVLLSDVRRALARGPYAADRWAPSEYTAVFNQMLGASPLPSDFEVLLAPGPGMAIGDGRPMSNPLDRSDEGPGLDLLLLR